VKADRIRLQKLVGMGCLRMPRPPPRVCELLSAQAEEFGCHDDCPVRYVLDPQATRATNGVHLTATAGDVALTLQQAGLQVLWVTSAQLRFIYLTYPQRRSARIVRHP
jgi:hypothetical protein